MSSNDKNKTPVSSPFNSPPLSPSPSPAPLFFSHLPPPPPYTIPFPISSAISSDFSLPPIHPPPPPSSIFDLEFLQGTTTTTISAPITTSEGGGGDGDIVPQHQHQPQPQPLEWLHETPVPPFLSKTYDLVDDAGLDSIIGWGKSGHSFVVWDPVEFSRSILPRNFKHNNFSSFVRQLNTYGFRKIDADKWEFANEEGFIRGKKHLLRNIQRRKPSQSQSHYHNVGGGSSSSSSSSSCTNELEVEIVKLREERSLMMQEVVQLQQQQRGTIQQMETVGEKLLAAEQRQKHMVSFLSKVFQNPAFLARINKQQQQITSPRSMRKFVKHHHHHQQLPDLEGSSIIDRDRQMVKYIPDLPGSPNLDTLALTLPELLVQEQAGPSMGLDSHNIPFPTQTEEEEEEEEEEEDDDDDLLIPPPHEVANDPLYKGKNVVKLSPEEEEEEDNNDELNKENSIPPEFSSSIGIESMVKEHELWDIGFEVGMSSSSAANTDFFWGNEYEIQKAQVSSSGLSDYMNWELGSLQGEGGGGDSGVDNYWPSSPFREIDSSKSP